jgi:hypothetical protein
MTFIALLFSQHYTSVGWFWKGHATSFKKESEKNLCPAGEIASLLIPPPLPDISGRGVHPEGFSLKGTQGVRLGTSLNITRLKIQAKSLIIKRRSPLMEGYALIQA